MANQCVVVADGARARFFALTAVQMAEIDGGPSLYEQEVLENSALAPSVREGRGLPQETRTREEHGGRHDQQAGRRFAKQVALKAAQLSQEQGAHQCIVAADPRMLGMLRRELRSLGRYQLKFTELAKDLTRLTTHEIQSHLARTGHLPARRAPRSVRPAA